MNTSNNQNGKSSGWKIIIASLSVTSLIGLINIFSNRDAAKTGSDSNVDALLNLPIPTLVPVAAVDQNCSYNNHAQGGRPASGHRDSGETITRD